MSRRGQRPAGDRTNRCSGAVKWALALTLTLTPAAIVLACEIPVYQWALLNWEPDVYELLVFHDEPLPPDTVQALQALTAKAPSAQQALNIRVRVVGPGPDAEADAAHIRQREGTGTSPWVALRHPGMPPDFPSLWTAGATVETLRQLSHSAARDKITDALLRGTSHVWVVLECGEQEKDAGAWSRLETALAEMAAAINPDTISPNAHITHEIVSVRRDDPAEAILVQTLLRSEPDLLAYDEPMVFPVFGRGRALYALVGAGITSENLRDACVYVAGRCSCLVKDQNPGVDLLLAADWAGAAASVANALPPSPAPTDAAVAEAIATVPGPRFSPGWYILAALAAALVLVAVVSAVLLRRSFSPSSPR